MLHNIPLHYQGLYYIYNCEQKWLYPCSEFIYRKLLANNSKEMRNVLKELEILSKKVHDRAYSYSYPKIRREDVLRSMASVPAITLEITESCNLSCVYCCYGNLYKKTLKGVKEDKSKILEYLKFLISLRKEYKVDSQLRIAFYGGEPLLRFDIIKACVALAKSMYQKEKLSFGLTTNGILLTKYMDYLVEHNFNILISMDGNKENNQYRVDKKGCETFEKVERNVETLYQEHPAYFDKYVSISTVLHNQNNCIEAINYFSKWKKTPIFSQVIDSQSKKSYKRFKEVSQQHKYTDEEIKSFSKEHQKESKELFPSFKGNVYGWENNFSTQVPLLEDILFADKIIYPGKSCFLFSIKIFISVDGSIFVCEKSSRNFMFGKIYPKGIRIFTKRINNYYRNINSRHVNQCVSCYKSFNCNLCYFLESEKINNGSCCYKLEQSTKKLQQLINFK